MMGVISHVTWGKLLKGFSLEPCVLPTGELVNATCQAKLTKLVEARCRYDILLARSQKLQTHKQTQKMAINIIDAYTYMYMFVQYVCVVVGVYVKA